MKEILKRTLMYIFKGLPQYNIQAEIFLSKTRELLAGKKILITGGSKGIGFYIAEKCISEGAEVLICSRNKKELAEAQNLLGVHCKSIPFDISDIKFIPQFMEKAFSLMDGQLDILVNNAGVSLHEKNFREVTEEGFDKQFDINLKGTFFLSQSFIQRFEKNENRSSSGNILFISSERGSFCTDIPYGLSKAAVNSLVGALSNRLYSKSNIRVNAISPGVTASKMTGRNAEGNLYYSGSPASRIFLPQEIAEVACFLLSDISKCISGEVIHCDAGTHLKCI